MIKNYIEDANFEDTGSVSYTHLDVYKRQTWDCVDISPEAIEENRAYVFINKESQRIRKESLNALDGKDVLLVFPTNHKKNSTVRILKTPKTESSVRKIFLPKSVANMLVDWKAEPTGLRPAACGLPVRWDFRSDFFRTFAQNSVLCHNRRSGASARRR